MAAPSPSNQAQWEPGTSLAQSFISTDGHKQQQPPSASLKGCNVSDSVRSDDATAHVLAGSRWDPDGVIPGAVTPSDTQWLIGPDGTVTSWKGVRTQKGINCQDLCSYLPSFSLLILSKVKKMKAALNQPAGTLTLLTLQHIPCIPPHPTSLRVVRTLIQVLQYDRGWRKHY